MNKSIGMELMDNIRMLEDLETIDTQLTFAIFKNTALKRIDDNINNLKENINSKMAFYNVKDKDTEEKNEKTIRLYKEEIGKIYREFEDRVISIQLEQQVAESNQKIAIANLKKIADAKKEFLNSNQYQKDMVRLYDVKINAFIEKFNAYNKIIDECLIETEICQTELINLIDELMPVEKNIQLTEKISKFAEILNKLKMLFNGKDKYEKEFSTKLEEDLGALENKREQILKETNNKSVKFIATIMVMKRKINERFKVVVG